MILCKYKGGGGALAEDVGRVAASAAKVADSQWGQKFMITTTLWISTQN